MSKNEQARDFAQKNPDCEVATKAYVKYLFRKNVNHKHKLQIAPGAKLTNTALGAIIGALATIILFMLGYANNGIPFCAQCAPFALIFTVICILVTSDLEESYITNDAILDSDVECKIKKYTPPKPDECEEEY